MSEIWMYFTKANGDARCNGCSFSSGKRFREFDLWNHLKYIHRDVYERTYEFEQGTRKVDDRNRFQCKECLKSFRFRDGLKTHLIIHTGERPYECQQCRQRFKQKVHLQKHSVVHTEERPYECPTCKQRFKLKEQLQKHSRVHTGGRPHECNACGKRFSTTDSLKRHKRLHTLELSAASADASAPIAVTEETLEPIADDQSRISDD